MQRPHTVARALTQIRPAQSEAEPLENILHESELVRMSQNANRRAAVQHRQALPELRRMQLGDAGRRKEEKALKLARMVGPIPIPLLRRLAPRCQCPNVSTPQP